MALKFAAKQGVEPLLYVPIETKVREFQAKLLLSCFAAEAGFEVVIGEQVELLRQIKRLPPGLYIDKGISPIKRRTIEFLKQFGHQVVSWCEEGLVIFSPAAYARDRVDEASLDMLDRFFAWGQVQASAIQRKVPSSTPKLILSGNPRFDLLRAPFRRVFQAQVDAINKAYGAFILINTNFGLYNNFHGDSFFMRKMMEGHGRFRDAQHRQFFETLHRIVRRTYQAFETMVARLSRDLPQSTIILRPHPSENHKAWQKATQSMPNVQVVHRGNVIPWLLAADVLIHHTCTTAVEAYVLGRPIISYCPVESKDHDPELPRLVSHRVHTEDHLVACARQVLAGVWPTRGESQSDASISDAFGHYNAAFEGAFACERITASLLDLLQEARRSGGLRGASSQAKLYRYLRDGASQLKAQWNRLTQGAQSEAVYRHQKFPGLTLVEMEAGIAQFQQATGRFEGIGARPLRRSRTCYRLNRRAA